MNDVPRLDARVVEEFFSRTATTRFIPPCLKHSCHSDRCANFSFPPPSFYRDQIRPVNFPLLSVRLSTTNLKMSQLGVARIRKFVLRWKKKKKKKPILEITIAQCIPRLMINIIRILRKILCVTFQREIIQNYVIVFIFFWDNDACRRDIRSWRRK